MSHKKAKRERKIDAYRIDLPKLMLHRIRERSLFPVLNALAEACDQRVQAYEANIKADDHPVVRVNWEEEINFFMVAAEEIREIQPSLEAQFEPDEIPLNAHGDLRRMMRLSQRAFEAGHAHLDELLTTLANPSTPEDDWDRAALRMQDQVAIWQDRKTGAPNFELGRWWGTMVREIADPNVPKEQKLSNVAELRNFLEWNHGAATG